MSLHLSWTRLRGSQGKCGQSVCWEKFLLVLLFHLTSNWDYRGRGYCKAEIMNRLVDQQKESLLSHFQSKYCEKCQNIILQPLKWEDSLLWYNWFRVCWMLMMSPWALGSCIGFFFFFFLLTIFWYFIVFIIETGLRHQTSVSGWCPKIENNAPVCQIWSLLSVVIEPLMVKRSQASLGWCDLVNKRIC